MKFTVEAEKFKEALESLQVKGKALTNSGFTSSNIGSYVYMSLTDNSLNIWNGNPTFVVNINVEVVGETNGTVITDSNYNNNYWKFINCYAGGKRIMVLEFFVLTKSRINIPIFSKFCSINKIFS